jgi:peptide-methionine (R)-S-oxide reductase
MLGRIGLGLLLALATMACTAQTQEMSKMKTASQDSTKETAMNTAKVVKSEEEWKKELGPEEYRVLREKGTERAWTGEYVNKNDSGMYACRACGAPLYSSETKFDSHCGWPSFYDAIDSGAITQTPDHSYGMNRIELTCTRCGSHLGHIFDDGPQPTGMRHCINSVSLKFEPAPPPTVVK